jgi:hypothetical protein
MQIDNWGMVSSGLLVAVATAAYQQMWQAMAVPSLREISYMQGIQSCPSLTG